MPNWCYNSLTISGSNESINKFDEDFSNYYKYNIVLFYNRIRFVDILFQYNKKKNNKYEKFNELSLFYLKELIFIDNSDINLDNIDISKEKEINKLILKFINKVEKLKSKYNKVLQLYKKTTQYDFINTIVDVDYNSKDEREYYYNNIGTYSIPFDIYKTPVNDNEINYSFMTRWSPPDIWVKNMIKLYKNIDFRLFYDENSAGFAGDIESKNGEIIKDEYIDFENHIEYIKYINEIDNELDVIKYLNEEEGYDMEEILSEFEDEIDKDYSYKYFDIKKLKLNRL